MTKLSPARFLHWFGVLLLAGLCSALGTARAQTITDLPPDMVAPPRLAVVEGSVQFFRPGADSWVPAQLNAALAEGDAIATGGGGTVEAQIGPRDFVRITANTTLTLAGHDAGMMQFRLDGGLASFDLRGPRSAQLVEIDTPNAVVVVGGKGYYRVFVREGETRVAVRKGGQATLNFADGSSRGIRAGEEVIVQGDDVVRVDSTPVPPLDSWDRWNDARSDYVTAATSNRYVPTDVYGAADLDQHGSWREEGTYGWVWVPAVSSDWAPYSTGSWQWDPVYGWTWVDVAPWGWTTSHYGRWVDVGGRWAWAPGPRGARATYAPALVAFYGGEGSVGWVALGWGEPLLPWWGRPGFRGSPWWGGWGGPHDHYSENHVYRNQGMHNGVIGMREDEFGRQHVRGPGLPMSPGMNLRPIHGEHPIGFAPGRGPMSHPEGRQMPGPAQPGRPAMSQPGFRHDAPTQPAVPMSQPQYRREPAPQQAAPALQARPEPQFRREPSPQPGPAMQPRPEPRVQPQFRREPSPQSGPVMQPRPEPRVEPQFRREPSPQPQTVAPAAPAPEARGGHDHGRDAGQQHDRRDDDRGPGHRNRD